MDVEKKPTGLSCSSNTATARASPGDGGDLVPGVGLAPESPAELETVVPGRLLSLVPGQEMGAPVTGPWKVVGTYNCHKGVQPELQIAGKV